MPPHVARVGLESNQQGQAALHEHASSSCPVIFHFTCLGLSSFGAPTAREVARAASVKRARENLFTEKVYAPAHCRHKFKNEICMAFFFSSIAPWAAALEAPGEARGNEVISKGSVAAEVDAELFGYFNVSQIFVGVALQRHWAGDGK